MGIKSKMNPNFIFLTFFILSAHILTIYKTNPIDRVEAKIAGHTSEHTHHEIQDNSDKNFQAQLNRVRNEKTEDFLKEYKSEENRSEERLEKLQNELKEQRRKAQQERKQLVNRLDNHHKFEELKKVAEDRMLNDIKKNMFNEKILVHDIVLHEAKAAIHDTDNEEQAENLNRFEQESGPAHMKAKIEEAKLKSHKLKPSHGLLAEKLKKENDHSSL